MTQTLKSGQASLLLSSLFALVLSIVFAASSNADAAGWQRYAIPDSGLGMDVPVDVFSSVSPASEGEGVTFADASGEITLSVYSIANDDDLTLNDIRDLVRQGFEGRQVTYQRAKGDWFVLSGYENDGRTVFYTRLARSPDGRSFGAFELVYPTARRSEIDSRIRRMSLSLKAAN